MVSYNHNKKLPKTNAIVCVNMLKELARMNILDDKTLKHAIKNIANGVISDGAKQITLLDKLDDIITSI